MSSQTARQSEYFASYCGHKRAIGRPPSTGRSRTRQVWEKSPSCCRASGFETIHIQEVAVRLSYLDAPIRYGSKLIGTPCRSREVRTSSYIWYELTFCACDSVSHCRQRLQESSDVVLCTRIVVLRYSHVDRTLWYRMHANVSTEHPELEVYLANTFSPTFWTDFPTMSSRVHVYLCAVVSLPCF